MQIIFKANYLILIWESTEDVPRNRSDRYDNNKIKYRERKCHIPAVQNEILQDFFFRFSVFEELYQQIFSLFCAGESFN